jgi:toxin ParE1/3/4
LSISDFSHLVSCVRTIDEHNPGAARRIAATLLKAVDHLSEFSVMGRTGRVAGTREVVVIGTPYVVPYRLSSDRLEVLAVFHGRKKWPLGARAQTL